MDSDASVPSTPCFVVLNFESVMDVSCYIVLLYSTTATHLHPHHARSPTTSPCPPLIAVVKAHMCIFYTLAFAWTTYAYRACG